MAGPMDEATEVDVRDRSGVGGNGYPSSPASGSTAFPLSFAFTSVMEDEDEEMWAVDNENDPKGGSALDEPATEGEEDRAGERMTAAFNRVEGALGSESRSSGPMFGKKPWLVLAVN